MQPPPIAVSVEKQIPVRIAKASLPLRYGRYSEIRTPEYEFIFNLNGEIKFIRGLHRSWPHPAEQLKRTDGNDWVYYAVGDNSGDGGIVSWFGEYYLPCLPYPSNTIWEIDYRSNPGVMGAFAAWAQLFADLHGKAAQRLHDRAKELIGNITANASLKTEDDGVSQTVTAKVGIVKEDQVRVPNPVTLRPYRTFPEIEQPEMQCVFRIAGDTGSAPTVTLSTIEDPRWIVDAAANIKKWLRANNVDMPIV